MSSDSKDYSFTMDEEVRETKIVVLGVGGMGNNAMENLARATMPGLELYSLNTDVQALRRCRGSKPVQLGAKRTGGKGAGGNSEVGRLSAEDDNAKIRKIVTDAEMVFIVSGMGGGTGSGATPVIAKLCRELGVLSVCAVTMPMECEGQRRGEKARSGLAEIRKFVDSLLIIENEKLSMVMEKEDVSIIEVFRKADKVVVDMVGAIAKIITSHGYINLDLADLKNVLQRSCVDASVDAYIGMGRAAGPERACRAAEIALSNPLLREVNILGAATLLVNVAGSEQLGHKEAMSAVKAVVERVGSDNQEIFMGVVTDDAMGEDISITVIATGLPPRTASISKIKSIDASFKRDLSSQDGVCDRPIAFDNNILINNHGNSTAIDIGDDCGIEVRRSSNPVGISPLISKEEWQTPAYLRAKVMSNEWAEFVPHARVSNINLRSQHVDGGPSPLKDNNCYGQVLYHMAG